MESNSPSGKYRCVVTEQLPPEGYYSPHLYTFSIRDALTNRDLKGESYRRDTDSVSLTDLKFVWFDNELTISLPTEPPRPILTAKFHNGEQRWTSLVAIHYSSVGSLREALHWTLTFQPCNSSLRKLC
jgi:hypothetical protein